MSAFVKDAVTRRGFLTDAAIAGAGMLVTPRAGSLAEVARQIERGVECASGGFDGATLAGAVPFSDAGSVVFGTLQGEGLDARLFTDLSTLTPETLVTPNDRFYIRTTAPAGVVSPETWKVTLDGLVRSPVDIALPELVPAASPKGPYVMECAGNGAAGAFGLMSAARWTGIPIAEVLARAEPLPSATRVLVSGVDHATASSSSAPGASWIFTRDELRTAGAFLATEMNGQPLSKDHGYPARLFVPRWYGCACIKWVNRISFVDHDAPSTPQMREFGPRTFQKGRPVLAREFKPAAIQLSAMPVRVEKWIGRDGPLYRVVGIVWGGESPATRLTIRFNPREPFVPLDVCPRPASSDNWSLWSHAWRPAAPGRYLIVLRAADPSAGAERLDVYYYTRAITLDEI
jgi:DMSO/TMAO reductase YedYZ molybdopterin-dependent catalytic subunit